MGNLARRGKTRIYFGDSLSLYRKWPRPTVIVSDGPYGIGSFPGDPPTPDSLPSFYEPHVRAWAERSLPETTLWFWSTEIGWATVHPLLVRNGWEYRNCHVWDKGNGHIAGNANSLTLRKFPVVTEVCVQYVRSVTIGVNGSALPLKDWLRAEWKRTGIPFSNTNRACGVKNAATRKYFTKDHLWYFPPPEAFVQLAEYANKRGASEGKPYFSIDGKRSIPLKQWEAMRAKFYCEVGITNVWQEPAVRGVERIKNGFRCAHMNQKPLRLLKIILKASSDFGDVVWEPFGGLCSVAIAARRLGRRCYSAEIDRGYWKLAAERLHA